MRKTKLLLTMLVGCTVLSGAAFAQDASQKADPTPASTAGSMTHTSEAKKGTENGSMTSTHKKHHKAKKTGAASTEPAKSSSAGM
ncbi:hypothetical protein P3W24_05665 [Luteibacter sp. PPL201]|jgi:hypothetical protein|uniref:Pentapeptide MXKDX repeat protein n=1 Tax=Luteibacter sahnii TaxID=3021977 RepID=A0ABT6B8L7_9GAMM|nr:hypothetical protein [Luteibacter sp. PPL193]MDY1550086.1 hypothetical protein [Luteibacter sp. PPL193]